jgi:hypothetical protein
MLCYLVVHSTTKRTICEGARQGHFTLAMLGWGAPAFLPMELGKPDAGKPSVRCDEGREAGDPWLSGLSIRRFPPILHPKRSPIWPRTKSVPSRHDPNVTTKHRSR